MAELLETLLQASEKAARIARAWRCQNELFHLLVEEKVGQAKNDRFVRDFKTLADVLVQEVVKCDVRKQFPDFKGHIYGEESNKFTNNLGQEVTLEVQDDIEATAQLLQKVLDGKHEVAKQMATLIHSSVSLETHAKELPQGMDLPIDSLAIWIDPIDGTGQYLKGDFTHDASGIINGGLPCATVLIGVFDRTSGRPIAGVINQPFAHFSVDSSGNKTWTGERFWGICHGGQHFHSCGLVKNTSQQRSSPGRVVAISESETHDAKKKLAAAGATLCKLGGSGYKLLKVIDHSVDFYFLSKDSCFKWDTCAPHAVLCSSGGGVVPFHSARRILAQASGSDDELIAKLRATELLYHKSDRDDLELGKKWCNSEGLIAFRSYSDLLDILRAMK